MTTKTDKVKSFEVHNGMKIIRLGRRREDFLFRASIYFLSTKNNFDLIHTSTYSAMIPTFVTSLFKRIPSVVSVHEVWSLDEMIEFYKAKGVQYFVGQKILLSLPFRKFFSPSLHTKKDLNAAGIDSGKIVVIPHGIDGKIFNPVAKKFRKQTRGKIGLKESDTVGLFIGKPTIFKGIEYLLDAIRKLEKSVSVKFIFVLSPLYAKEQKEFLRKIENDTKLKRRIIILKADKDQRYAAKLIGASDFVVMPSLSEGFGFVAAEAASIGIPTIVTSGTSLAEVVEKNHHAVYVKPRDSDELARAIEKLAKDAKLRKKLSRRKVFKSWQEVADEYEKVYQSITKNKEG